MKKTYEYECWAVRHECDDGPLFTDAKPETTKYLATKAVTDYLRHWPADSVKPVRVRVTIEEIESEVRGE